ncbi:hypothetical protein FQZ97_1262060 [compost metagenome]
MHRLRQPVRGEADPLVELAIAPGLALEHKRRLVRVRRHAGGKETGERGIVGAVLPEHIERRHQRVAGRGCERLHDACAGAAL